MVWRDPFASGGVCAGIGSLSGSWGFPGGWLGVPLGVSGVTGGIPRRPGVWGSLEGSWVNLQKVGDESIIDVSKGGSGTP